MKLVLYYIDRNVHLQGPAFALTEVNAKNLIGFNDTRIQSEAPFMGLSEGNKENICDHYPSLWLFHLVLPQISTF